MNPVTLSKNQRIRLFVSLSIIYLMLLTPLAPLAAVRPGMKTSGSRIKISSDRQATQREESVPAAVPAPVALPMAGPLVTATTRGRLCEPDRGGQSQAGSTLYYTVNVSNT